MRSEAHSVYHLSMKRAKTVRFTKEEEAEITSFVERTGEQEALVLQRSAIRGLREERFDRALLAYLHGASAAEAADLAGLDRHTFIDRALDRNVAVTADSMLPELARVADYLGDQRLAEAVRRVSSRGLAEAR